MVAASLLLLQTAHGRPSVDPRLVGEWSDVRRSKGFDNLSLTLRANGSFIENSLVATRPTPPLTGHVQVRKADGRLQLEFYYDPVRVPIHRSRLRVLTLVPAIPALIDGENGGFVPTHDVNGAARRLRAYWQTPSRPRKHR